MALAQLKLSHATFYTLTLSELAELIEAKKQEQVEEYKRLAQLAVWITAPHLKKPLSVDKLVKFENEQKRVTKEEKEKELKALEDELG